MATQALSRVLEALWSAVAVAWSRGHLLPSWPLEGRLGVLAVRHHLAFTTIANRLSILRLSYESCNISF